MKCSECNRESDLLMCHRGSHVDEKWCCDCHAKGLMRIKLTASLVIPILIVLVWLAIR